jgi:hypothetical protein
MPATISTWNLKDAETEKKVRAAVEELFKKYPDDWRVGIREGINNETWEIKVTAADGRKNAAKKAEITSRQWYRFLLFDGNVSFAIGRSIATTKLKCRLLLQKLSLEMTFNLFTTQRVSGFGRYDRIDDLIAFCLRGDKCAVFWQFLVDELHFSAVFRRFDPLFVGHF